MAEERRMTAAKVVDKLMSSEHADVVRESVAWMVAELMEAEVAGQIGAELGEIAPDRVTHRNGYRPRAWQTRAGEIELAIPKLRSGSYFPSFLEPRKRSEQALVAVVQEAYVNGVSTRKVDRLVEQLRLPGMSKDQGSRRGARDEQGPGRPAVPRPGRAGPGLPAARARGPLPVSMAGRQGRARPRAGRGASEGAGAGLCGARDRPARGARPRRRRGRERAVLARVPAVAARPRAHRRAAVRLRRPRRAQKRDRPGARLPVAA